MSVEVGNEKRKVGKGKGGCVCVRNGGRGKSKRIGRKEGEKKGTRRLATLIWPLMSRRETLKRVDKELGH